MAFPLDGGAAVALHIVRKSEKGHPFFQGAVRGVFFSVKSDHTCHPKDVTEGQNEKLLFLRREKETRRDNAASLLRA
jgi:hypothetical protein